MPDREKVKAFLTHLSLNAYEYKQSDDTVCGYDYLEVERIADDAIYLLKEHEAKQYNSHEVACIIADLFGDPCACNFNDIDTWLPYKCDFEETCCPNPVGVACWEQYLKHKEGR